MTITHQKYTGRTLYLMVEVSAGVYAQVGGLRADSLSIGNEEIDITDKSDDTWKKLLAGGNRTLGVSGSGFVTSSAAFETLQAACHNGTPLNAKLVYKAGKAYAAPMLVTSCELNGEYNGAQQFSASLSSMNTPYIGIAGAVPTLDLNFAETGSIQPNIGTATMTHTRSTAALYRDVDGLLKSASANVPRFEHDVAGNRMGYLPELASTNLLLRSQEFDNASWTKNKTSIVANAAVAPDGTATADEIIEDGTAGGHYVSQVVTTSSGAVHTFSVFIKDKTRRYGDISSGTAEIRFDLSLGTITLQTNATGTITPYRDGWWRITATFTTSTTTPTIFVEMRTASSNSYTGDAVSSFYMWGAQFELQPQDTSYIATTSAQVTRTGDALAATSISGLSVTEGALVIEFYAPATAAGSIAGFGEIGDGTTQERGILYRNPSNGTLAADVVDGGAGQAAFAASAPALGSVVKIALGVKANDFAASFAGAAAGTDTGGTMFTPDRINVGCVATGPASQPGRPIKRVSYYATKPSNSDIVALAA